MVLTAWAWMNGIHTSSMEGTIVSCTLIITICNGMLIKYAQQHDQMTVTVLNLESG